MVLDLKDILRQGKISFYFLLIVIFFLPISRELFVIAVWPWIFFLILESFLTRWSKWYGLRTAPITVYILPGMFLLLLISLLWTENLTEGWRHIGRSTLMIVFPILLGFDKTLAYDEKRIQMILKSFVFGTLASLIVLIFRALFFSISFSKGGIEFSPMVNDLKNVWFYSNFSVLIHPSYYGMMVLMAAAICLNGAKIKNFSRSSFWQVLLGIGFLGSLFFIASRTMILASIGVISLFPFIKIPNRIVRFVSVFTLIIALIFVARLHPRFNDLRGIIAAEGGTLYNRIIEQTARGKTWTASFQLIKEQPVLGLGIGDVKNSLSSLYLEENYFPASHEYLNCHNQFLESWLGVGILGLFLLIFLLIHPILSSQYLNQYLYGSFFLITLIGFLFESQLNRLWGVAFVSIFYILFTTRIQASSK